MVSHLDKVRVQVSAIPSESNHSQMQNNYCIFCNTVEISRDDGYILDIGVLCSLIIKANEFNGFKIAESFCFKVCIIKWIESVFITNRLSKITLVSNWLWRKWGSSISVKNQIVSHFWIISHYIKSLQKALSYAVLQILIAGICCVG